jgi:4-hydroxybenzoate polyprenyltransferase
MQRRVGALGKTGRTFPGPARKLRALVRTLRPQQWAKNVLLFVPALLAHQLGSSASLVAGFLLFSLCASGVYVANDLLDIQSDRQHPRKKTRPFAAGELSAPLGVALAIGLPLATLVGAYALAPAFAAWLAGYLALTLAYSFILKLKPVADVITLAALYTCRLFAGAALAQVELSTWVLAFGMFVFLSLAFVKRFTELLPLAEQPSTSLPARGYLGGDLDMIRIFGPVSGYLAVLVFALYLESDKVRSLYAHPARLWLCLPALLYWITRLWLIAQRRALHHDPVIFALRDPESYVVAAWMIAVAVWAAR